MRITRNLLSILLLTLLLISALPAAAFAAPEDEVNITMEYRYSEDDGPPTIPANITQLGREYRLISQAEPVLESTLPTTRTYTYRIDGNLSAADLAQVANVPGLVVTPVQEIREREVDVTEELPGLRTNDADDIPAQKIFEVTSATDPNGTSDVLLTRAGLKFDEIKDGFGFPLSYTATVVYRGIETYSAIAYYTADTTYTTEVPEGEINQYVIIAIYEPVDPPVLDTPTNLTITSPEQVPESDLEFSAEEWAMVERQTGNPLLDIASGAVPLGNLNILGAWSFLSLVFSVIAVLLSVVLIITALRGRKGVPVALDDYALKKRSQNIKLARVGKVSAIILGLVTAFVWLLLDNLSLPIVLVNGWTLIVGTLLVLQLAALMFSVVTRRDIRPNTVKG